MNFIFKRSNQLYTKSQLFAGLNKGGHGGKTQTSDFNCNLLLKISYVGNYHSNKLF
jgi:hypothetical protein